MPISSGAGGRQEARVAPTANKRATLANRRTTSNLKRSPNWPGDVTQSSPALAASSDQNQRSRKSLNPGSSWSSSSNSIATSQARELKRATESGAARALKKKLAREDYSKQQPISVIGKAQDDDGDELGGPAAINQAEAAAAAAAAPAKRARANQARGLGRLMNSLGGQRVVTGGAGGGLAAATSLAIDSAATTARTMSGGGGQSKSAPAKQAGLFTSLMLGGGGGPAAAATAVDTHPQAADGATGDYKRPRMLGGKTYMIGGTSGAAKTSLGAYHLAGQQSTHSLANSSAKSSLQNSQASLLNPSMSLLSGGGAARNQASASGNSASASSAGLANLHNLHNLHNHNHHNHHHHSHSQAGGQRAQLNISKRVNLKYVKSLIVLLMSLDLLITIFVHHFASNDQLAIAFTSHKLRFSLLNLILSAVWFLVLAGAIIFDVYPLLLLGCLVDFASFLLLLVCSAIHFTHRIDYNTVNLTSLLLLLFSIIVLHVYLLVIAALTTYLMLAVKRRRRIQS